MLLSLTILASLFTLGSTRSNVTSGRNNSDLASDEYFEYYEASEDMEHNIPEKFTNYLESLLSVTSGMKNTTNKYKGEDKKLKRVTGSNRTAKFERPLASEFKRFQKGKHFKNKSHNTSLNRITKESQSHERGKDVGSNYGIINGSISSSFSNNSYSEIGKDASNSKAHLNGENTMTSHSETSVPLASSKTTNESKSDKFLHVVQLNKKTVVPTKIKEKNENIIKKQASNMQPALNNQSTTEKGYEKVHNNNSRYEKDTESKTKFGRIKNLNSTNFGDLGSRDANVSTRANDNYEKRSKTLTVTRTKKKKNDFVRGKLLKHFDDFHRVIKGSKRVDNDESKQKTINKSNASISNYVTSNSSLEKNIFNGNNNKREDETDVHPVEDLITQLSNKFTKKIIKKRIKKRPRKNRSSSQVFHNSEGTQEFTGEGKESADNIRKTVIVENTNEENESGKQSNGFENSYEKQISFNTGRKTVEYDNNESQINRRISKSTDRKTYIGSSDSTQFENDKSSNKPGKRSNKNENTYEEHISFSTGSKTGNNANKQDKISSKTSDARGTGQTYTDSSNSRYKRIRTNDKEGQHSNKNDNSYEGRISYNTGKTIENDNEQNKITDTKSNARNSKTYVNSSDRRYKRVITNEKEGQFNDNGKQSYEEKFSFNKGGRTEEDDNEQNKMTSKNSNRRNSKKRIDSSDTKINRDINKASINKVYNEYGVSTENGLSDGNDSESQRKDINFNKKKTIYKDINESETDKTTSENLKRFGKEETKTIKDNTTNFNQIKKETIGNTESLKVSTNCADVIDLINKMVLPQLCQNGKVKINKCPSKSIQNGNIEIIINIKSSSSKNDNDTITKQQYKNKYRKKNTISQDNFIDNGNTFGSIDTTGSGLYNNKNKQIDKTTLKCQHTIQNNGFIGETNSLDDFSMMETQSLPLDAVQEEEITRTVRTMKAGRLLSTITKTKTTRKSQIINKT